MKFNVMLLRTFEINEELLESCASTLYDVFDEIYVEIAKEFIEIPRSLFNPHRNQYLAEGITYIASSYRKPNYFAIMLSDVDAYVPGLNFVFGLAIPVIKSATVFTYRLKFGTNYDNYVRRIQKEVIHELGHLLGLNHCTLPRCVMRFSNSVFDVDLKEGLFCPKCANKLIKHGYKVKVLLK